MQQAAGNIILICLCAVSAHSWLECTNYVAQNEKDLNYYNPSQCHGYARCGGKQKQHEFGVDTGFDHNKKGSCQCPYTSSPSVPIATYSPGQKVCLAYPPKNHVASPKTNAYIPDNGVIIRRTAKDNTKDEFMVEYPHLNGKHENGKMDYKGFQHCPNFDDNMDKALCTMCFVLENGISPGQYSFSWEWQFNPGSYYTTCWEASIAAGNDSTSYPAVPSTDYSPTNSTLTMPISSITYASASPGVANNPPSPYSC